MRAASSVTRSKRPRRSVTVGGLAGQHAVLNHFIRPQQERLRDRQAERPGRLHVDRQLERGRLLDREVSRLSPSENLVQVRRASSVQVRVIRSVGYEPADLDKFSGSVHRGKLMFHGKFNELSSVRCEYHVIELDQAASAASLAENAFKIVGFANRKELQLDSERPRGDLRFP